MTITEFLLARIAEDQHLASLVTGHRLTPFERRLLSLPETHRRIVEHLAWIYDEPHSYVERTDAWECAFGTLQELAVSYAEHPDFREEWRRSVLPTPPVIGDSVTA
ncbi:MAG TPA: DUF6221 family protein [Nocardioides sp.]|nr:DUF6221 family protein [Nocardioides sp.]